MKNEMLRLGLRRFLIVFVISGIFVFVLSEVAYYFMRSDEDRPPQEVELVIPAGTSAAIQQGGDIPSIPAEMSFVVGDVLIVRNEDDVPHELGPLFIPAGSKASLSLADANNYAYSCSFRPSQYLGISVRETTTLNIRVLALVFVTPATAMFFFVYSLAIYPLKVEEKVPKGEIDG